MDFTIIIVNWNGANFIANCLYSLLKYKFDFTIETIVIDNHSADNSVEIIENNFKDVKVIESGSNIGFAKACNLGLSEASGKYVMFLNPDTTIMQDTFLHLSNHFAQHPKTGAIGCQIVDPEGNIQPLLIQESVSPLTEFIKLFYKNNLLFHALGIRLNIKDPLSSGYVIKLSGACLTARREILMDLEGFDERFFMYCEDGELSQRIIEAGWDLYYLSKAVVVHNQGACSRKAPKGFSTLMQLDSFSKRFNKYHGLHGRIIYRLLMFIGGSIKLVISLLTFLSLSIIKNNSQKVWKKRLFKNWLIFKWSLFMAKPTIPS